MCTITARTALPLHLVAALFEVGFAALVRKVCVEHHGYEVGELDRGLPTQFLFGFGGITEEELDFRRAKVAGVHADADVANEDRVFKPTGAPETLRESCRCLRRFFAEATVRCLVLCEKAPSSFDHLDA